MTAPAERAFVINPLGHVRDVILTAFRNGLRERINPATGQLFTEDEIRRVTMFGSRFWVEANAIDVVGLGIQQRARFFADQIRVDRAGTSWLTNVHGPMWGEAPLPATGGGGTVEASAIAGSVWVGSTTVPDPAAVWGTDPAGQRFQVLVTTTTPASGTATLTVKGIDTGETTNLTVGTKITWAQNQPLNCNPEGEVVDADFEGGFDAESDGDFSKRLASRIRHKPAAGNSAHFRAWARAAPGVGNAVEDCFVYPCGLHAGSVVLALTQKRGSSTAADARIPSTTVSTGVSLYLVAPGSPVVPARAYVLLVPVTGETVDSVIQIAQKKGSAAGWADPNPWPGTTGNEAVITSLGSPPETVFTMTCDDAALPTGVTAPQMMLWDDVNPGWVELDVSGVSGSGGTYTVTLNVAPNPVPKVGHYLSPYMARHALVSQAIVAYMDELGPGEIIDLTADTRADRAFRWPEPSDEYPQRFGQQVAARIPDALGGTATDAVVVQPASSTTPSLPTEVIDGPNLLIPGHFGIYDLP